VDSNPHESARRNRRDRAEAWRLSTSEDLESTLKAAERLLRQAEERSRHEQNRTGAILSVMAATVLSLFAGILLAVQLLMYGSITQAFAAIISVVAAIVVLGFSIRALLIQRQRVTLDFTLHLATQMSSMVSEALLDVADREKWSYLRLQSTKLRLSAFPLLDSPLDAPDRRRSDD
jgi:cation transport ATPase